MPFSRPSTRVAPSPFGSRLLGAADESPRRLRWRIQILLTWVLITTNLLGATAAFFVSSFLVPAPLPTQDTILAWSIALPTYIGLAVVVGAGWGTAMTMRALRWAVAEEVPDDRQRTQALLIPLALTAIQLLLWAGGTTLFTILAVVLQPERALATGLTVGITSIVVAAIIYLEAEFTLRPVAARALAGDPNAQRRRGVGVAARMAIFWSLGTAAPLTGLVIAGIVALAGGDGTRTQLAIIMLVTASIVLVIGFVVTLLNARAVTGPIRSVRDAMRQVERGNYDVDVVVYDGTELGRLQSGFNHMVHGLREREQIRDLFGRHVGREVAAAAADLGEVELGGETRMVSVLFVDLVGSTTYATEHSPAETVAVLNRFFGVVVDEVDRRKGLVNKFIGDAVLAIFGAPVPQEDHPSAALATARAMAKRLADEVPEVGAGIGVATGTVVAGNVGHEQRFEYTVIGDAVNCAARLTDLAKDVPGLVLATWDSVAAASPEEAAHWTRHGSTVLRGRSAETELAVPLA